jgi:hypothetical protein
MGLLENKLVVQRPTHGSGIVSIVIRRFGVIASLCPDGKFRPNGHADWDRLDAGDPHGVEFRARQD